MAEVNKDGEVTVEEQFVGRLEGFRFQQDASASPDEAKILRTASLQALAPEFHLRADRMYNAPDTELDFTEQGGLMWGTSAVGKLILGPDALKPHVLAFVDEEAGPETIEKVTRRLQHFIDRRIVTLFEPLLNMERDETLTGMARGFAFQMIEGLGLLDRADVCDDVKTLDQEARGALRKHGVRFGQFTVFMPLMLKPAPTRLRLLLWSLFSGLQEFPKAPSPGLVTVLTDNKAPVGYHLKSGYRAAGERALRVDMAERLADMLRTQNTRGGFEATADMLSITGMTLEQFSNLMQGLGYRAEKAERKKIKSLPAADLQKSKEVAIVTSGEALMPPDVIEIKPVLNTLPPETPSLVAELEQPIEMEIFYTFAWGTRHAERISDVPRKNTKPRAKPQSGRGKKSQVNKGLRTEPNVESLQIRPVRKEKEIDPDNPFAAALMGYNKK